MPELCSFIMLALPHPHSLRTGPKVLRKSIEFVKKKSSALIKRLNWWLVSYLAIVLLFSGLYFLIWSARPDSFIVNSELNLDPLSDVPLLAWQEVGTLGTTGAPSLSDISKKLAAIKAKINALDLKVRSLDQQVDSYRAELAEVGRRNETMMMANGERYRQDVTAEASRNVAEAERVLKAFSERGSSARETTSLYGVAEANLRVKVAELRVVQAEQIAEAYRYFTRNIGQFGDPKLTARMDELHEKSQTQALERQQASEDLMQQRKKLIEAAQAWREQRLKAVSWEDFLFFSIGISTTTTYGDVVGNSRLVRSLIATQLLICVFVMAGFVSSVVSRAGRRDGETSLSPAPGS